MKIALGQINTTIGDFTGNSGKIIEFAQRALAGGAGLALFPELSICGYPPRDLVENPAFVRRNQEMLQRIADETRGIAVICGLVTPAHADTGISAVRYAALRVIWASSPRILKMLLKSALAVSTNTPM